VELTHIACAVLCCSPRQVEGVAGAVAVVLLLQVQAVAVVVAEGAAGMLSSRDRRRMGQRLRMVRLLKTAVQQQQGMSVMALEMCGAHMGRCRRTRRWT
jgi:hypothetical protein